MEFSKKIQELRNKNKLTQEQFAEKLYVSRTAVSKWESGKGYPSIDSLKYISKIFNVSIDELLSNEEIIDIAKNENTSNIEKINNLVNGDLRNIASRVEKMNELANEYNNYAGIQNGMAGEVKFIMITDSTTGNGEVKKEEAVITTEAKDSKEIKENKEE